LLSSVIVILFFYNWCRGRAISAKATKTLNFVRRNIYRCPPDVKALAYTSLIRPHLDFASAAWDPYAVSNTNCLDKALSVT